MFMKQTLISILSKIFSTVYRFLLWLKSFKSEELNLIMQKIIRNYFINDSIAITRTDQKNQEYFEKECDILFKCFNSREYFPCFQRFANFINSLLPFEYQYLLQTNDKFARALVSLRFFQGKFDDVCNLLQNHNFNDKTGLLKLWDTSHYRLREVDIGRPLNAVKRFRVRQSNPPPKGICVDGTRPTLKLPTRSLTILRRWFTAHIDSPYPTQEEKTNLSKETGLTLLQIKTWMSNTRRREKQHPGESSRNKCGTVILANIQKMKYVGEQKEVEGEEESSHGVSSVTRRDAIDLDDKHLSTLNPMDPENRPSSISKSSVLNNGNTSNQLKEEIVQSSESLGALQNICNNLKGKCFWNGIRETINTPYPTALSDIGTDLVQQKNESNISSNNQVHQEVNSNMVYVVPYDTSYSVAISTPSPKHLPSMSTTISPRYTTVESPHHSPSVNSVHFGDGHMWNYSADILTPSPNSYQDSRNQSVCSTDTEMKGMTEIAQVLIDLSSHIPSNSNHI